MIFKLKLLLIYTFCTSVTINSYILQEPSFSPDYVSTTFDQKKNSRQNFLDKRRQSRVTAKRVKFLDQYLSNSSVYVDGITHYIINENHTDLKEVNKIEKAFRVLIAMEGVKYTYKRGPYWRTWRRVKYPDGNKIVCYKCENSVNCTSCNSGSYWVIEDTPPACPFEIVSVINELELCATNLMNSTNVDKPCPSVVQFNDITRWCDNPIETKWRLIKDYNKEVSERYPSILCNGRDFCEISTIYLITRDYVSFRIINSTNHILYSRIMKNDKKNYACVTDCGKVDPTTRTVSKSDKPLVVDLITKKNKRHDKTPKKEETSWTGGPGYMPLKSNKLKQSLNEMETFFNFQLTKKLRRHDYKTHPSCSSLKYLENNTSENE